VSDASTRVLVVDDHAVLRSGLRLLLGQEKDLEWVGEAGSVEEALRAIDRTAPDVVLLDLNLPGTGGIEGLPRVLGRRDGVRVLILSMNDAVEDVKNAFSRGASGYVLKSAADEELINAIRAVMSGDRYLDPSLGARLARPSDPSPIDDLSEREREVLRLLALGYTNQEAASRLIVGVRTVESHRANVMAKLRVDTRAAMVQVALRAGLLDEDRA
jgi:two-component system response regulator NreC